MFTEKQYHGGGTRHKNNLRVKAREEEKKKSKVRMAKKLKKVKKAKDDDEEDEKEDPRVNEARVVKVEKRFVLSCVYVLRSPPVFQFSRYAA